MYFVDGKYHVSDEPVIFVFRVDLIHSSSCTTHGLVTIPTELSGLPHEASLTSTAATLVQDK
jgi:hypothetical protein